MLNAINIGAALTVLLLLLALVVVWSRRDIPMLRAAIIPFALIAALGSGVAMFSILGFAVPLIGGITAPSGDAPLLAAKLSPGKGIFLTIDLPSEPRLFWTPWNKETADALQEMLLGENSGIVVTVPPYEWSWSLKEPDFQALPQPKVLPDKPPAPPQAPRFEA